MAPFKGSTSHEWYGTGWGPELPPTTEFEPQNWRLRPMRELEDNVEPGSNYRGRVACIFVGCFYEGAPEPNYFQLYALFSDDYDGKDKGSTASYILRYENYPGFNENDPAEVARRRFWAEQKRSRPNGTEDYEDAMVPTQRHPDIDWLKEYEDAATRDALILSKLKQLQDELDDYEIV